MCGVVGILLKNGNAIPNVIEGLSRLEYRGYDSSGILTINNHTFEKVRSIGKLDSLKKELQNYPLNGAIAIGHTRWATHGGVTINNAHPHESGCVAIVHNGIIENHHYLKNFVQDQGYQCMTDTDTEVIAHLIDFYLRLGFDHRTAVQKTLEKLEGTFSIVAVFKDNPSLMIGARHGSPLAFSISDKGSFIASDAIALSLWSDHVCYLEDKDMVVIDDHKVIVFDEHKAQIDRSFKDISHLNLNSDKLGYSHYMLKEIFEQPKVVHDTFSSLLNHDQADILLDPKLESILMSAKRIKIVACGTSYYAGLLCQYWMESYGNIGVDVEIASEFRYRQPYLGDTDLAILISQSGETIDTLASLDLLKTKHIPTLGIVNVLESSLMRRSDFYIQTLAGIEVSVASTKAFSAQITVLLSLVFKKMPDEQKKTKIQDFLAIPKHMNCVLDQFDDIMKLCKLLIQSKDVIYMARGINTPIAFEGALKLKELSYINAQGYPAGELKHGPIALIDESIYAVVIAPSNDCLPKTLSNVQEILARRGKVILVTDENSKIDSINLYPQNIYRLPYCDAIFQPFLTVMIMQMLAFGVANLKGQDVDQPRNLAKSVTVE
jgi:glucosamine--fructose-6-phosphate aminotransferase (isomerizing)